MRLLHRPIGEFAMTSFQPDEILKQVQNDQMGKIKKQDPNLILKLLKMQIVGLQHFQFGAFFSYLPFVSRAIFSYE